MKRFETGRTLIETLGVLAFIGILTVSGLSLYAKAMNTIRANYIMEQVFILANQLTQSPVAVRHKMADANVRGGEDTQLAYGFEITNRNFDDSTIRIVISGPFTAGLCRILDKKRENQEYAGLARLDSVNDCDGGIREVTFEINADFEKVNFEGE